MTAKVLDGKAISAEIKLELKRKVEEMKKTKGFVPGLAVVLVGDDPASKVYVGSKAKNCQEYGFYSEVHELPASTRHGELLKLVRDLGQNSRIHGILVQSPLPKPLDYQDVVQAIPPEKDVDGFHPINVGRLSIGLEGFVPCTPLGCMHLLKRAGIELGGLHAVVVGRSNIVGKPMAQLLINANATVTVCHSKTRNLADLMRQADIVVAAVGKPRMISGDMIKPGAVVLDVGINRMPDGKLLGDVDFESASQKASWITPVPGGVGVMTIAMLLQNTFQAALGFATRQVSVG